MFPHKIKGFAKKCFLFIQSRILFLLFEKANQTIFKIVCLKLKFESSMSFCHSWVLFSLYTADQQSSVLYFRKMPVQSSQTLKKGSTP